MCILYNSIKRNLPRRILHLSLYLHLRLGNFHFSHLSLYLHLSVGNFHFPHLSLYLHLSVGNFHFSHLSLYLHLSVGNFHFSHLSLYLHLSIRLNHNKVSKSVTLLMKNQLFYTPFYFVTTSLYSISFYFSKNFRYTSVIVHFLYNFKVITYMAITDSTNL